ncbi:MAG TPA: cytochrome C [Chromatiales bacterium]|nr:cytochrome C [Chromatiales bacterium]
MSGRRKWLSTVALLAGLAAGCAGAPTPLPEPGSEGERLMRARCGACHAVPHPARLRAADWPAMLALMERRMAERGMAPLGESERETLLGYLRAHARR